MCKQKVFEKDHADIKDLIELNTPYADIARKYGVAPETMGAYIKRHGLNKPIDPEMRAYTPHQIYKDAIRTGLKRFIIRRSFHKDMAVIPMDEYLQLKAASNGQ